MVARPEQHEAARPDHLLNPCPGRLRVAALGQRLLYLRVEPAEPTLEGGGFTSANGLSAVN